MDKADQDRFCSSHSNELKRIRSGSDSSGRARPGKSRQLLRNNLSATNSGCGSSGSIRSIGFPSKSQLSSSDLSTPTTPLSGVKDWESSSSNSRSTGQSQSQSQISPYIENDGDSSREEDVLMADGPENEVRPHPRYDTCFGMIQTGSVKVPKDELIDHTLIAMEVLLKINGSMTMVYTSESSKYLGLLDPCTADVLARLSQSYSVTLRAFLLTEKKKDLAQKPSELKFRRVYILVYGIHLESDNVGNMLSEKNVFLQHPKWYDHRVTYSNPHYLLMPGTEIGLLQYDESREFSTSNHSSQSKKTVPIDQITSIFDSAQGPMKYSEVRTSDRLTASLKSYQRKGVAMMVEKESGVLENNEFGTLWEPWVTQDGKKRYRNVVSGNNQLSPPFLCLGGLLADEMGLGKTLTILTLIATSLDILHPSNTAIGSDVNRVNIDSKTTLVVTPLSTLSVWENEIKRHFKPGSIKYAIYHGNDKGSVASNLLNYDIIITTYDTLSAERIDKPKRCNGRESVLQSCKWFRIVLDEGMLKAMKIFMTPLADINIAHTIKDRSTSRHRAVCALEASHRWCLTGSPIQNRVDDFGALLGFLRVHPYNTKDCFNSEIAGPIKNDQKGCIEKLRRLINSICLRRTKKSCNQDLQLQPRIDLIESVDLTYDERRLYSFFRKNSVQIIDSILPINDKKTRIFHSVIQSILKLRQICNHGPDLLPPQALEKAKIGDSGQETDQGIISNYELDCCGICGCEICPAELDNIFESALPCLHNLCRNCVTRDSNGVISDVIVCPLCADVLPNENFEDVNPVDSEASRRNYQPSSKVMALMKNLRTYRKESTAESPIKSVIFTEWVKMINLVEQALSKESFSFERLDGQKSDAQRRQALKVFGSNPDCTILLASIRSAGVGLNLTAACRVHILEPQWNPMAEEQALDRVHRMGQTREVIAIRYIVKESIEEYVVSVQRKKLELIQNSLDATVPSRAEKIKERLEELRAYLA